MTGGDEFDDVGRRWLGSSHMVGRGTADATRLARMADGLTGTPDWESRMVRTAAGTRASARIHQPTPAIQVLVFKAELTMELQEGSTRADKN